MWFLADTGVLLGVTLFMLACMGYAHLADRMIAHR